MNDIMLNEYKQKTKEICMKKGWDGVSIDHLWLFLIEEVGELASSIRRTTNNFSDRKKVNIEGEIMDVMSYLLQIADIFDIDLDEAWGKYIVKI
jgi:NTP pyrophosphatase (non-canonical NTP hydrolase)